jgi:hypothetical protein
MRTRRRLRLWSDLADKINPGGRGAVRLIAVRYVSIALALAIAWLLAGRQIALLLDRFLTLRVASFPVTSIRYDGGGFVIKNLSMTFGSTDNLRFDLSLHSDSSNRVVLCSGGRSFVLGPRTNPIDPSGRPEIDLVPKAGDKVSFTGDRSLVGWPTPFEFNFMTRSPWWKRFVYYRLVWRRGSRAKLEMLWRYEQDYYIPGAWTEPVMMWNGQTGLLRVTIRAGMSDPNPSPR